MGEQRRLRAACVQRAVDERQHFLAHAIRLFEMRVAREDERRHADLHVLREPLGHLLVAADGAGPGFVYLLAGSGTDGTIALSAAITRFEGEAEGDLFGFSAAAADVTQDGVPDLLVGAPASNRSGALTGSAWLFEGPFAAGAIPTTAGRQVHGEAGAGSFGSAVALGPDMNLDGVPDLAVGEYTSDAGGGFSGALYLISP